MLYFSASTDAAVGPVALATNILKEEGPKGLYRGIAPNFMKVRTLWCILYVIDISKYRKRKWNVHFHVTQSMY